MQRKFMNATISPRRGVLLLLALGLATAVAVALVAARFVVYRQWAYSNLVWNVFLAWLPLGFALAAARCAPWRGRFWAWAILWLLFLPNSPYLVTDLVHLKPRLPVPFWFDILLVQWFVSTGLFLGFLSLFLMHRLVSRSHGYRLGWGFTVVVIALTGFGIYLGRFERWNSWDLFVNPLALTADIWRMLRHPIANKTAFGFSALCAAFLFLTYGVFYGITALQCGPSSSIGDMAGANPQQDSDGEMPDGQAAAFDTG
jgi:uncharacterized membrane protein